MTQNKKIVLVNWLKEYWIFFIVGLSLFLLFFKLSGRCIWCDEGFHIFWSSKPFSFLFSANGILAESHPPLSYIPYKIVMLLFGKNLFLLRSLSVVFGLLTIIISFKTAKLLFNKKVALLSSIFVAISPYFLLFSRMIRYYPMSMFVGILSIYLFFKYIQSNKTIFLFYLIIVNIIAVYTLYFCWFLIIAENIIIIFDLKQNKYKISSKKWFFSQLLIVLFFLPVVLLISKRLVTEVGRSVAAPAAFSNNPLLHIFYSPVAYGVGQTILPIEISFYILLIITTFFFIFSIKKVKNIPNILKLWIIFGVPVILAGIVKSLFFFKSSFIYTPNQILFCLPIFWIIVSVGIIKFNRKFFVYPSILAIVILSLYGDYNYFNFRHYLNPAYIFPADAITKDIVSSYKVGDSIIYDDLPGLSHHLKYFYNGPFKEKFIPANEESMDSILICFPDRLWLFKCHPESQKSHISDDFLNYIKQNYMMINQFNYVEINEKYVRLKEKLFNRQETEFKFTTFLYKKRSLSPK